MNTAQPERFHALDATRAFALLLGVVFHAAWTFVPRASGAPVVDPSGGLVFEWFFFTSHTFRMQLFFLIAGFFARLVYHRRGASQFAWHRFKRIAIPLLLGWVVLYPLIVLTWVWGGNVSGRNLTETPLMLVLGALYGVGLAFVPRSSGGLFSLGHLWFLYYLLWFYGCFVLLRFLAQRVVPEGSVLRTRVDQWVSRTTNRPWPVVLLALLTGLFLWGMEGWFGVDTPANSLVPSLPVLLLYGTFFGLGWLLHRQADLLKAFARHWRWQMVIGLALSLGVFAGFQHLSRSGVTRSGEYPQFGPAQITDWPAFLGRLQSAAEPGVGEPRMTRLWAALPPAKQAAILNLSPSAHADVQAGVCEAVNKVLVLPDLFRDATDSVGGPGKGQRLPATGTEGLAGNRRVFEDLFQGTVTGDPRTWFWFAPAKLAYSLGYGLVMWLLVFGTLGFFQDKFRGHSAAWRYVADSSYWIYLLHIPLVPFLQVWMMDWPWPGMLKFLVLNVLAFIPLFLSYHFLVRSTFIGALLNGRRHPFVAWPFRQRTEGADTLQAPVEGRTA